MLHSLTRAHAGNRRCRVTSDGRLVGLLLAVLMLMGTGCVSYSATRQKPLETTSVVVTSADCATNESNGSSDTEPNAAVTSGGDVVGGSVPEQIWNYLIAEGFTEQAAAAALGNAQQESGFDSSAVDGTGAGDSIGIFQFTNEEKRAYLSWSNNDMSVAKQLDWMFGSKHKFEGQWIDYAKNGGLRNGNYYQSHGAAGVGYYHTVEEFKKADDISKATMSWMACYERPSDKYSMFDKRVEYAKQWYEKFTGKSATASSTAQEEGKCSEQDSDEEASVSVGEAANVGKSMDERLTWLYGSTDNVPQTDEENKKWLVTFDVKVRDLNGQDAKLSLTMHKKIKEEVIALFNDIYNNTDYRFDVNGDTGSLRDWDAEAGRYPSLKTTNSNHAYGLAIDVNATHNNGTGSCDCGAGYSYNPGSDSLSLSADSEVVKIFKKHGFFWGGDWTTPKDYMHFAYTNH